MKPGRLVTLLCGSVLLILAVFAIVDFAAADLHHDGLNGAEALLDDNYSGFSGLSLRDNSDPTVSGPSDGGRSARVATTLLTNGDFMSFFPMAQKPIPGFDSQFNGDAAGWDAIAGEWLIDSDQWYTTLGVSGKWASASFSDEFSDFDYEARFLRTGCSGCANHLIVRGSPSPLDEDNLWSNFYIFQYNNSGLYSVWLVAGGADYPLQAWTEAAAINQGAAWNTLRVIADGSDFGYYINGILVWSGSDADFSSGRVGVGMYHDSSANNQLWIDYATLSTDLPSHSVLTQSIRSDQQLLTGQSNQDSNRAKNLGGAPSR